MAEKIDVLICGGGSAGLCAGVWLARCGINFRILERRPSSLKIGQADGAQSRTVEIFDSFGLVEPLLKEGQQTNEMAFWAPESDDAIKRTRCGPDTEAGLSHLPGIILSQARMNELLTNEMERATGRRCVEYDCEVQGLKVDSDRAGDPDAYCVAVKAVQGGTKRLYHAKYVLGSDGAHSVIRKSLGFKMLGDTSDMVWGVMDVYSRTNFPDIRKKTKINSGAGNTLIIPREGDYLNRFYIELDGAAAEDITLEELHEKARLILRPYTLEVAETKWWSAYSIGQRLADNFHKDYRVFLSGDACHTHSPKAGQGMNVSLQDGYNIGWKLAAVLRGQAGPKLLETYVSERHKIAADLIEFDRNWSKFFSTKYCREHGITSKQFYDKFLQSHRYIAGQATQYKDSLIVSAATSESASATGLSIGMRFPSAPVVRLCDAVAMQLIRALPADSKWHIVVFAGDIRHSDALMRLQKFSTGLEKVINAFTPLAVDRDAVINPILVLSSGRSEVEQDQIPAIFTPIVSKWKVKSLLKVFVDEEDYNSPHSQAYDKYGVAPSRGAVVVVRPDHYISKICSLGNVAPLMEFFGQFMKRVKR